MSSSQQRLNNNSNAKEVTRWFHTINRNDKEISRLRCCRLTYSLLLTFHCPRLPYTPHLMLWGPTASVFDLLLLLLLELSGSLWCNCWSAAGAEPHSLVKVQPAKSLKQRGRLLLAFPLLSSGLSSILCTLCALWAWQRTSGIISRGRRRRRKRRRWVGKEERAGHTGHGEVANDSAPNFPVNVGKIILVKFGAVCFTDKWNLDARSQLQLHCGWIKKEIFPL